MSFCPICHGYKLVPQVIETFCRGKRWGEILSEATMLPCPRCKSKKRRMKDDVGITFTQFMEAIDR